MIEDGADGDERGERVRRMEAIYRGIGLAVLELQSLEKSVARYLAIRLWQAEKVERASITDEAAKRMERTFGGNLSELRNSNLMEPELSSLFKFVLGERNWLIHNSRENVTKSIFDAQVATRIFERINAMTSASKELHAKLVERAVALVAERGVSSKEADDATERIMKAWREPD